MIFIDGGYLDEEFKESFDPENDEFKKPFGPERINFENLSKRLRSKVSSRISRDHMRPELIRVLYYNGILEPEEGERYEDQKEIFNSIKENPKYEVKLGRLIRTGSERLRQKGVDILLAIDMLSKAYLDHYDIALILTGDGDYVNLINAVKDGTGKVVFGSFFPKSASSELVKSLDEQVELDDNFLEQIKI